ncbi:MAG: helix-turn-helix domain-containing protein [Syntrophobacteraceae bacterium]
MRNASKIALTDEQRSTLLMWVTAGKTEQRLAKRAQVILCAASDIDIKEMETKTGLSWQSCLKWRKRFRNMALRA